MELRVRPAMSENGKRYTKRANRFSRLCSGGIILQSWDRCFCCTKTKGNWI